MATFLRYINRLLPFTDASTPLWRDAIHTVLLCTFLYFAPNLPWHRISDSLNKRRSNSELVTQPDHEPGHTGTAPQETIAAEQANGALLGGEDQENEDESEEEEDLQALEGEDQINVDGQLQPVGDIQGDPGPVNPLQNPAANRRDPNRPVGAKKAKSLARRDRVRAYNEFQRAQGDAQRAKDAEGAEEREAAQKAERDRRRKVEMKIEQEKVYERRVRKREEEERTKQDALAQDKARDLILTELHSKKMVSLTVISDIVEKDASFVDDVVRKDGILGEQNLDGVRTLTLLTKNQWVIRVDEGDVQEMYAQASQLNTTTSNGKVDLVTLGHMLEQVLRNR